MTLIDFQDAVTAKNLDPNAKYGVYYVDGRFANHWAVQKQCPHAKLFGITVFGALGKDVFACDCESGDLTPSQAEAWVAAQVKLGVPLICVYASLDVWEKQGLLAALAKYGKRIKRWVAHYNNVRAIPDWADADQYADPGPIDRDVALANFFTGISPAVPAVPQTPKGHARFEGTVDIATGKVMWVRGLPGLGVHFAGPEKWLDVCMQLAVGKGGGQWRPKP